MVNLTLTLVLGLLPYYVLAQGLYPLCQPGYSWVGWHKHLWSLAMSLIQNFRRCPIPWATILVTWQETFYSDASNLYHSSKPLPHRFWLQNTHHRPDPDCPTYHLEWTKPLHGNATLSTILSSLLARYVKGETSDGEEQSQLIKRLISSEGLTQVVGVLLQLPGCLQPTVRIQTSRFIPPLIIFQVPRTYPRRNCHTTLCLYWRFGKLT